MSDTATLQRIERKLDALAKPKPKWVKASVITELTDWDKNKMFSARKNGTIDWKLDTTGGYLYDLNSLHSLFVKKTA